MTLDATAREANFRDSIKKYLVDSLVTVEGVPVLFDSSLGTPNLKGRAVDKWYRVSFGSMSRGTLSQASFTVRCCTREDSEGFKLAQLGDKLMGYLSGGTAGDSTKRITLYQSSPTAAWTAIGGIVVVDTMEGAEGEAEDKTKFKAFEVLCKFASKI